jgi:hypothetical protein
VKDFSLKDYLFAAFVLMLAVLFVWWVLTNPALMRNQ